jgi:5-methylcytosine-specific restriction endonuclease McrA
MPRQGGKMQGKYCTRKCALKAERKKRSLERRTADRMRAKKVAAGERINPFDIFERDGWKCQLCGKRIKRGAIVPDPMAAVIDHIHPLANGGEHTARNVQCAHFLCNSKRSNVGLTQGRLFG